MGALCKGPLLPSHTYDIFRVQEQVKGLTNKLTSQEATIARLATIY